MGTSEAGGRGADPTAHQGRHGHDRPGLLGNPWLFQQAKALWRDSPSRRCPLAERCDTAVRQFELAAAAKGERGSRAGGPPPLLLVSQGRVPLRLLQEQIVQMNTLEDVYRITRGDQTGPVMNEFQERQWIEAARRGDQDAFASPGPPVRKAGDGAGSADVPQPGGRRRGRTGGISRRLAGLPISGGRPVFFHLALPADLQCLRRSSAAGGPPPERRRSLSQ